MRGVPKPSRQKIRLINELRALYDVIEPNGRIFLLSKCSHFFQSRITSLDELITEVTNRPGLYTASAVEYAYDALDMQRRDQDELFGETISEE